MIDKEPAVCPQGVRVLLNTHTHTHTEGQNIHACSILSLLNVSADCGEVALIFCGLPCRTANSNFLRGSSQDFERASLTSLLETS